MSSDLGLALRYGGRSRAEMLSMLSAAGVCTNEFAEVLLASEAFDRPAEGFVRVVGRSVNDTERTPTYGVGFQAAVRRA